jgi:hypothetical protein
VSHVRLRSRSCGGEARRHVVGNAGNVRASFASRSRNTRVESAPCRHMRRMNTLTGPTESVVRPELPLEHMFEPRDGAHLPAATASEEVLDRGTVEPGISGDRGDTAPVERFGQMPGDPLCVHGLDGSVTAELSIGPRTGGEMVQRTASRHGDDGTSLGSELRGPCHTPVEYWSQDAGISRHQKSGKEPTMTVETLMAHEVPDRVRMPSTYDKIRRGRAATLICRAVAGGVPSGAELIVLYRELLAEYRPAPRERAVQATAVTVASQYLRQRPDGEMWALIDGRLTDPAKVGFGDRVDALAWRVGADWTVDVISVALRVGQVGPDLTGGRVTRSARALERILDDGGTAEIRVWTLQFPDFLSAVSMRTVPAAAVVESPSVLREVA